ncbi:MAG: hypothetical protein FP810_14305 [Desulfocapsa sp.]|nr:hypothetical protein [Desulfocapsa sp.]
MKDIYSLVSMQGNIKTAQEKAMGVIERLGKELEKIAKEREHYGHSEMLSKKEAEIRAEHSAAVIEHYQAVVAADDELAGYRDNWMDIEHILSTRPVSAPMGQHIFKPMNQNDESLQRLALATELKNCSAKELTARAGEAMRDKKHGELYLIHKENVTRQGSPGWEPVDLSGVVLPDQRQAKICFAYSRAARLNMAILEKSARGVHVDPTEKLSYGHALTELEVL